MTCCARSNRRCLSVPAGETCAHYQGQSDGRSARHFLKHSSGNHPANAKPLKGFGSGVFEIRDNFDGDTYRAVYTVRLGDVLYVLHVFQKKSTKGIATPKRHLDLVRQRLRDAETIHRATEGARL
jgi:phage-related protein